MLIKMNIYNERLTLTQQSYLNKVVTQFGMKDSKHVNIPIAAYTNLSNKYLPKTEEVMKKMENIP